MYSNSFLRCRNLNCYFEIVFQIQKFVNFLSGCSIQRHLYWIRRYLIDAAANFGIQYLLGGRGFIGFKKSSNCEIAWSWRPKNTWYQKRQLQRCAQTTSWQQYHLIEAQKIEWFYHYNVPQLLHYVCCFSNYKAL